MYVLQIFFPVCVACPILFIISLSDQKFFFFFKLSSTYQLFILLIMLYLYVVSKMSSRNQSLPIFSPTPSSTSLFSIVFCLHFGIVFYTRASLVAQIGEGNGTPLQCSCLENPRDWGAWWATVYGVTQSRTRLK